MKLAMEEAGVQPEQVGYINAHGTSTPANDQAEAKAIQIALVKISEYLRQQHEIDDWTFIGSSRRDRSLGNFAGIRTSIYPPTINVKNKILRLT